MTEINDTARAVTGYQHGVRRGVQLVDAVASAHALSALLNGVTLPPDDRGQAGRLRWARRLSVRMVHVVEGLVSPDLAEAIRAQLPAGIAASVAAHSPAPAPMEKQLFRPSAEELDMLMAEHARWLHGEELTLPQWRDVAMEVAEIALSVSRTWPADLNWFSLGKVGVWLRPMTAEQLLTVLGDAGSRAYRAQNGR